jgi:hypothetical protein
MLAWFMRTSGNRRDNIFLISVSGPLAQPPAAATAPATAMNASIVRLESEIMVST